MELSMCSTISQKLSPPSFGISNDEINHSESCDTALFSKLEHFRNQKPKAPHEHNTFGVSDMSLMDDFVEMEKLAIVTVDTRLVTCASSSASSDASNALVISLEESGGCHLDARGKELVPVVQGQSSDIEQEIKTKDVSTQKSYDWFQNVLKLILDQTCISKRSFDDILEDIRIALTYMNHSCASEANTKESSKHPGASDTIPISGYITGKSPNKSPRVGSLNGVSHSDTYMEEKSDQHIQFDMGRSICKIIKLIRRIDVTCSNNSYFPQNVSERDRVTLTCKLLATPLDYLIGIFQWKSSEISTVLQQFVQTCDDLLDGKVKFENFAAELASALDWIINHCIISQDDSTVSDKMNKNLSWYKSQNASQLGNGVGAPFLESDNVHRSEGQSTCLLSSANGQNVIFEMDKTQSDVREENRSPKG